MLVINIFSVFTDAPPSPPSFAQQQVQKNKEVSFNYKNSLVRLIKNRSFMCLLIIYGIHEGVSIAVPVLLNQIILAHYPVSGLFEFLIEFLLSLLSGCFRSRWMDWVYYDLLWRCRIYHLCHSYQ